MKSPDSQRGLPVMSAIITVVLCGIAMWQQYKTGTVSTPLLMVLGGLVGAWFTRSFDGLDRWFRK